MKHPDFDRIKKTTDIVRVIESYGIALKRQGADLVGLCPFHDDHDPSLRVTPGKNLFRCPSCGASGNVIQFVARKEGIPDKQAALKLLSHVPGVYRAEPSAPSPAVERRALSVEHNALLKRVVAFYAKTLHSDQAGYDYLKSRNLVDPTTLEIFQVGYCNGTLHKALPKEGNLIEELKAIGILDKRGQEILRGRITVPIFDADGNVSGLYARFILPCEKKDRHRYLAGPHRGVFNGACAKTSQTLFITEAILDTMALWQAGFKNVISLYGTDGWTPDHQKLIEENGTTEIYLCLDNDETGRKAAEQLKEKLSTLVKAVHVVSWPEGVQDACDFFLSRSAADFEKLLEASGVSRKDAKAQNAKSEVTERLGEEEITMTPDGFTASYGARRYEVRAIEKPSAARLKATVKATLSVHGSSSTAHGGDAHRAACGVKREAPSSVRFHIDTVDFYLSRSRRAFIMEAARIYRETAEVIEMDLNRLTVQLESYIEKRLEEKAPQITLVSDGDKREALRLGRNPDLVGEILRDIEKLGMVGEKTNALAGYLVMTSRKMEDPLALLILSCSGAGKSHLQDVVLSLCPDEDLIKVTSLSDRALFYKGEDSLKHKALAIEEEAGAMGADYAIRNLISSKKLVIETTIKNPLTGKMETQMNRVNGPTAVFKTTTNPETNAETRSRFIITSIDESIEQTRGILAAQRNAHTLEGLLKKKQRAAILCKHHAFGRLLRPLHIVNPFEPLLTYGDDRLLIRRDNPKYLHLILAVTFLHQMQRPVKNHPELGDYIEATLADMAIANELACSLFGQSLDDLSSPARELLRLIADFVRGRDGRNGVRTGRVEFNRRELREAIKWTEARLRSHLGELMRMEYVLATAGGWGKPFCYTLAVEPDQLEAGGRFVVGLKSVEQLQKETLLVGKGGNFAGTPPHFAGASQPPICEVKNGHFLSENGNGKGTFAGFGGGHIPGKFGQNGSHILIKNGSA